MELDIAFPGLNFLSFAVVVVVVNNAFIGCLKTAKVVIY